jgi:serine/threonine protein kinase
LRIIDFGLSGHFDAEKVEPQLTNVVGTPHYMAPEIVHDQAYNAKVDIWACGIIAYRLFSKGRFPFDGEDEFEISDAAKAGKIQFAQSDSENWVAMSEHAEDFVRKMLVVNPRKRMSAAAALRHPWLNFERQCKRINKKK